MAYNGPNSSYWVRCKSGCGMIDIAPAAGKDRVEQCIGSSHTLKMIGSHKPPAKQSRVLNSLIKVNPVNNLPQGTPYFALNAFLELLDEEINKRNPILVRQYINDTQKYIKKLKLQKIDINPQILTFNYLVTSAKMLRLYQ